MMVGLPLVKLEQKIGASWVDLTSRGLWSESGAPVVISRGVGEDGMTQIGTMTVTLANNDGALTPKRSSSPYYPNLTRFRQIRFSEYLAGAWRARFTGYIDDERLGWGNSVGTECRVNLTAIDAIGMLSRKPLRSVAVETTAERAPLAYWPLTEAETAAATDQSGKGRPGLTPKQIGTGGELAWGGGKVQVTDSSGGLLFTPESESSGWYLSADQSFDLPATWYASVIIEPAAKDGYVFQIGTSTYSIGVWYDTSTKKLSAIETKLDSSGDAIDYVLSTSTSNVSAGQMYTLTVTPTTVTISAGGTAGARHSGVTMLDSLVAVGGALAVESGRARLYSGEVKHLALWSTTSAWGSLSSDTITGPAALKLLSTAVVKLAKWSGLTVTATVVGTDREVQVVRTEGVTAADLFGQYMQGTLSRIAAGRDGSIRIACFDYSPTPVLAPAGVIDPTVEWGGATAGDVTEAVVSWPDGTQYVARGSDDGQSREIPGVLPGSNGRSVADWIVATSDAAPRVPVAPFDLLTIPTADAHALAILDIGDILSVPGLPSQLPDTTQDGIVDAFVETIGADVWTASIPTSADSRANMFWVGDADRGKVSAGFLAAPLGPVVDDTNSDWSAGDEVTHTKLNADAWAGGEMQTGTASFTPAANTASSFAVTFPVPFSSTPTVIVTPFVGFALWSNVKGWAVTNESTTGFTLWVYRTDAVATFVYWAAVN